MPNAGQLDNNPKLDRNDEGQTSVKHRNRPLWRHPVSLLLILTVFLWLLFVLKVTVLDSGTASNTPLSISTADQTGKNTRQDQQRGRNQAEKRNPIEAAASVNFSSDAIETANADYIEALHESFAETHPQQNDQIIRADHSVSNTDSKKLNREQNNRQARVLPAMSPEVAQQQLTRELEKLVDNPEQLELLNRSFKRALR